MNRQVVVVTGGGQGIGRAIAERLIDDHYGVVVVELTASTAGWLARFVETDRVRVVEGDVGDDAVARKAVQAAGDLGFLVGWVNNAAVFRDAWLHEAGGGGVSELIRQNLQPCLAGSAAAVAAFHEAGTAGSIVNVSSHQATRPVRGALPYATAKAAVEGLTRALAVDYGPWNIRVNAVALGSVVTERLESLRASQTVTQRAVMDEQMKDLHPLGRAAYASEVASAVAYLLSDQARFVTGAVLPVDGGRSVQGPDPESRNLA